MWRQILTVRKKGNSVKTMQESKASGKTCIYIWYSSLLNESVMPFGDPWSNLVTAKPDPGENGIFSFLLQEC